MKVYHVETQEDYDDLMIKLEEQGYKWMSGDKPTIKPQYWDKQRENTAIVLDGFDEHHITRGSISWCKGVYSNAPIIKHKAKGVEKMEKVVVPQCVADWYEEHKSSSLYKTLYRYLNNVGMSCELSQWQDSFGKSFEENLNAVEEIIAKMHMYDYEVEEKKYYWRKKKEYTFDLEPDIYINVTKYGRVIFSGTVAEDDFYKTEFTEAEIKELVSEEDFNKLEKVEIEQVVN